MQASLLVEKGVFKSLNCIIAAFRNSHSIDTNRMSKDFKNVGQKLLTDYIFLTENIPVATESP